MRKSLALFSTAALAATVALPALANHSYTVGGTTENDAGVLVVESTDTTGGHVDFSTADGTTFSSLTTLSADYNVTDDDCGGGSPRFSIGVDQDNDGDRDGYVHVYFGPAPSFTGCTQNAWVNTGNLIASTDARFDLTQFGGPFYGTHAQATALVGSGTITEILLVSDSGWMPADHETTIRFDNVTINGTVEAFDPVVEPAPGQNKDACKDGGWKTFNHPTFKNQGQCIKHFNHR